MEGSPNPIAWLALLSVIPFAFLAFWRLPPRRAAMVVMFGGAMFLPCVIGVNLPLFPDFDKEILPALSALAACVVIHRQALKATPFRGPEALLLVACIGAMCTVLTNADVLVYGTTRLPAQTFYDGLADTVRILLIWFPPFFLGRALFRSGRDLRELLRFLVFAGLIYSLLIMVELRMSPQLHNWLYGFHQSSFDQTIRFGGYRPKVLMRHGLNVALFMTMAVLASAALYRAKVPLRKWVTPGRALVFLIVILIAMKSTGAYFFTAALLPLVLFAAPRLQRVFALGLVALILGYPFIRAMGWVPVEAITDWMSEHVNEERALSLWFRMFTEEQVLENARERIFFGWGGYGRPYEFDPRTGQMTSVLDGYWAIELGMHGVVGFASIFGLVLLPVVNAMRSLDKIESKSTRRLVASLALFCATYVFDWIPNSSISADLTFMTGALAGIVPGILEQQRKRKRAERRARADANRRGDDSPPGGFSAPAR